ncbi:MAG: hypothetical protein EPN91_01850 [Salinibacterium sp.]|nr:MAG: hypothetical protein EPN91_01850 [Salinibacterium sp.]
MDWMRVGPIVANVGSVLANQLENAEPLLGWHAPDTYDVTVHVIPTAIPARPTLNLFVHSIELIEGPANGASPAPITGIDMFILMTVSDSHSSEKMSDNYRSREVFAYAVAYLHEHPTYSWVTSGVANGKSWSASISWHIERLPLTPAEAEGFFVAGQAPMSLSAAYRLRVQQVKVTKPGAGDSAATSASDVTPKPAG